MPYKLIYNLIILHPVASVIFWINEFPPSTPGTGLSNKKGPGKFSLGNMVDYKKIHPQPGEYVQVHQEDEPLNTISIDQTVDAIVLGPQ